MREPENKKILQEFSLRRQQRRKNSLPVHRFANIVGDEPLQEYLRVIAKNAKHAPLRQHCMMKSHSP